MLRTSRPNDPVRVTPPAVWTVLSSMKKLLILCIIAAFMFPVAAFGETEMEDSGQDSFVPPTGRFSSVEELKDKRIGVVTGSCFDTVATEQFPDAQLFYFNNAADMLTALKSCKIDAEPYCIADVVLVILKSDEVVKEVTGEEVEQV